MKILLVLIASLSTLIGSATNTSEDVSPAVLQAFKSTFGNAQEVHWNASNQFYKAQFTLDGQYISAFYNGSGSLVALTRNITVSQLPVMLQAGLKNEGKGFWISEIFEYATDEGTSYYATLENADMKITLRSSGNGEWNTYKKIDKI
jgi:mRNA deadenylase 3'-5' endonuclease subunit Ccr4